MLGPIDDPIDTAQVQGDIPRQLGRLEHAGELEPQARDAVAQAGELGRVLEVDEAGAAVVIGHADGEDAADGKGLEPRHDADGGSADLRGHHRHLVTQTHPQHRRQFPAQDDVEGTRRQGVHLAADHVLAQFGDLILLHRLDAAHQGAADLAPVGEHDLHLDEGRGPHHGRMLPHPGELLPPVRHVAIGFGQGGVGGHAENALLDLLVEAVHHRQDHDEGDDAQHDPQHGDEGDEGDEVVAPLGSRVAQANEEGERSKHGPIKP